MHVHSRFKRSIFVRFTAFLIIFVLTLGDPAIFSNTILAVKSASARVDVKQSIVPLPRVSGQLAGYIAGEFNVSERGSANYSIPIEVLPGAGGVQPQLSLNYDSRGGNGPLGMGFSLGGFSAIIRCPTTKAQDGFIDGVDFDANDKLCLDGQRLVVTSGTYGGALAQYHTENETFQKVISHSTMQVNRPASFRFLHKDGLQRRTHQVTQRDTLRENAPGHPKGSYPLALLGLLADARLQVNT